MSICEFEVIGLPVQQGSKSAFVRDGKAVMTEAAGAKHEAWRTVVAQAARDVADQVAAEGTIVPIDGPIALDVEFRFPCPTSRSASHRAEAAAIGAWRTVTPDLDKLVRSIGDALTAGGLIRDDARICRCVAEKFEVTGWTGARIRLERP